MVFVHPSWFEGFLIWVLYGIPLFVCVGLVVFSFLKAFTTDEEKWLKVGVVFMILTVLCVPVCEGVGGYLWHESYEVPSVQSKIVTVDSWQPKAGIHTNENGVMVIDNADQLMMVTEDGEGFLNEENFLFQKFDTRDILNELKPHGKYNITYYGWREGFNSGFPNILSVNEVVDESNATNVSLNDYFGTKLTLQ